MLVHIKTYKKVFEQSPIMLLGEPAYVTWYTTELGMVETDAKEKWKAESINPKVYKRTEHGVLKVAVKGHTVIVTENGG